MRKKLTVFLLCCALLIGLSLVSSGAEREVISADDLRKEFADNQNAAEAKYLGKTIFVEGIVISTGMSRYLTPNVVLSDKKDGTAKVICVLPRLDANKLSDFETGQKVIMSGRVYRLSERGVIIMKECKVAE
jgi:hypothetical protein